MATGLYNNFGMATMYDVAQQVGSSGKGEDMARQKIIEMQAQTNEIWQALPIQTCNDGTKEKAVLRTALPDVAWRMINQGVKATKSSSEQIAFTTGGVEGRAEIDERLMQLNKNSNVFRLNENYAHQEAMSQKMCTTLFYGDEHTNPASFTGLGAYFYDKTTQEDVYAKQIIDAGGSGNNLTSLWIVTFAPDTVYGIVPEGIPAGYQYNDMGKEKVTDKQGGAYYAYVSQFKWDLGLAVKDPRYVVRVANIDTTSFDDNNNFIRKLIMGYNQIHNPDHGRTFIFCNRQVQTYLAILASEKKNVNLRLDEFAGKKIEHFWGAPILRNDAILNTESQVPV